MSEETLKVAHITPGLVSIATGIKTAEDLDKDLLY